MGTRATPPSNSTPVTNIDPGNQAGTDQIGMLVELRVISMLLNDGLNTNYDLDALRRSVLPFIS